MRAGIYARISSDDGTELGVDRQVKDCIAEAERRGWDVVDVYRDNDVSATTGRPRPAWQRLVADVNAQRLDAIVVWSADRLTRTPRENEDVIDWARNYGVRLANVGGDVDLSTPDGQLNFRIRGAISRHETDQASRRIKRKFQERAEAGLPHGMVAYGYRRVDGKDLIDPEQADVIRETARRLLAGESLRSIVATLNAQGRMSPRGKRWESTTLRQIMLRDRNAGLRRHQGHVVGRATWDPIYDADTHARVVALLTDPNRRTSKGAVRKHLLSHLARCGRCDGPMRVIVPQGASRGRPVSSRYGCSVCFKVTRLKALVEEVVEGVVIERLSQPDTLTALAAGRPERARQLREQIDGANARLALAADSFAEGALTGDQLRRITARLQPQVEAWSRELNRCAPRDGLLDLTGADAAKKWASAPLDVKRSVIDLLMSVHIMPQGSGQPFDPHTVRITWKD